MMKKSANVRKEIESDITYKLYKKCDFESGERGRG